MPIHVLLCEFRDKRFLLNLSWRDSTILRCTYYCSMVYSDVANFTRIHYDNNMYTNYIIRDQRVYFLWFICYISARSTCSNLLLNTMTLYKLFNLHFYEYLLTSNSDNINSSKFISKTANLSFIARLTSKRFPWLICAAGRRDWDNLKRWASVM